MRSVTSHAETITFDDAGGGNLLGGLVIGALHGDRYFSRVLGPEWFSFGAAITAVISSSIIEMVRRAGSPRRVILCHTDFFNRTAHDLTRLGFSIERQTINGTLQQRTEEDFFRHLIEIGLPPYILNLLPLDDDVKHRRYRELNEFCASYFLVAPASRRLAAKENCCMLKKLLGADIERVHCRRVPGRLKRCVECGEIIGRVAAYRCEGAERIFYIHEECAPWVM